MRDGIAPSSPENGRSARAVRSILAFFPKNFYAFSKNPIRDLKSRRNEAMNRFLEGNKVIYVLGGVGFRVPGIRRLQLVIKNFTIGEDWCISER